ncbi:MAG TPA: hypothetical protein VK778_05900 [Solirubrobacteraceae bacterium]|jgi:hypothetical protein|nr:hypothetical protein [Solirubrobacteraceae bacterium]
MIATALGEVPALPLHTAGKYVAGAYIVLFALVLIYVAIMAIRLSRLERDLGELLSMSASSPEGEQAPEPTADMAEPAQDSHAESTPA